MLGLFPDKSLASAFKLLTFESVLFCKDTSHTMIGKDEVARAGWRRGVTIAIVIIGAHIPKNGGVRKRMICFGFDALVTMESVLL